MKKTGKRIMALICALIAAVHFGVVLPACADEEPLPEAAAGAAPETEPAPEEPDDAEPEENSAEPEPQEPAGPAEPAEPETPTEPAEPAAPSEPGKPAEPAAAEPEEPAAPEKPAEPEQPAPEQPAEPVHFGSGYVRMKDRTDVYTDPNQTAKTGTLAAGAAVWAVSAVKEKDPENDWLQITFDTEEAREAGNGLRTGYVRAGDVKALTEAEAQQLAAGLEADPAVRKTGTHPVPAVSFEPAEEAEEEEPAGEPAEEPAGEPAEAPDEEPAGEPAEEPAGESGEAPEEEPAEEPAGEPAEEDAAAPEAPAVLTEEELAEQGYRKATVIAADGTEVFKAPAADAEPAADAPEVAAEDSGMPGTTEEDEEPEAGEDAEPVPDEAAESGILLENGTILWLLPEDDAWGRIQTIPAEEEDPVITGYVLLADVAVYLEDEPEEKPAARMIRLTSSLEGKKAVYPGQEVVLKAELEGFREDDVYTVQWQYSEDGVKFKNVKGATELTWSYTISEENFGYTWALVVTLEAANGAEDYTEESAEETEEPAAEDTEETEEPAADGQ